MRRPAPPLFALALVLSAAPAFAQEEPEPPKLVPPRPSVVIDAKDDAGHDVKNVTVYVDDKPVAYALDGQPIEIDPGPHTIAVQRNEGPRGRAVTTLTLGE